MQSIRLRHEKRSGTKRRLAVTRWEKGYRERDTSRSLLSRGPRAPPRRLYGMLFFLIERPFDTVGVVDQAVEDPVGLRRVADLRVATRHRLVRGANRGSGLIPVFADFPEVTTLPFV